MNFFKRNNNQVEVHASLSIAGLLISVGPRDYLLRQGAETNSFIANHVSETDAKKLHDGYVVVVKVDPHIAREYGLID